MAGGLGLEGVGSLVTSEVMGEGLSEGSLGIQLWCQTDVGFYWFCSLFGGCDHGHVAYPGGCSSASVRVDFTNCASSRGGSEDAVRGRR